jgi:hypothetical protein
MACQRCQHRHVDRSTMANGEVWLSCRRCGWAQTAQGGRCLFIPANHHVHTYRRLEASR